MVRAIQSLDLRKSEVQDFPLTISKTVKLRVPSQVNDFLVIAWLFCLRGCHRQVDLLAPACLANPSRRLGRESTGLGLFVLHLSFPYLWPRKPFGKLLSQLVAQETFRETAFPTCGSGKPRETRFPNLWIRRSFGKLICMSTVFWCSSRGVLFMQVSP